MTVRIRQRHARWKPWRFVQRFFLFGGLLAVGYAAYAYAELLVYQRYEDWIFDRTLARQRADAPSLHVPWVMPRPGAAGRPERGALIGKLAIPRVSISAIVKEGVDGRTLRLAAGHIPATALPGQPGNVGISAHRDTLFRNLKNIQPDDEITLTTLDGQYSYRVVSSTIVNPTDVSVLASSPNEKTLTLVTCYPFYFVGHAPKRFVVHALQLALDDLHPAAQRRLPAPPAEMETRDLPFANSALDDVLGNRKPIAIHFGEFGSTVNAR